MAAGVIITDAIDLLAFTLAELYFFGGLLSHSVVFLLNIKSEKPPLCVS